MWLFLKTVVLSYITGKAFCTQHKETVSEMLYIPLNSADEGFDSF